MGAAKSRRRGPALVPGGFGPEPQIGPVTMTPEDCAVLEAAIEVFEHAQRAAEVAALEARAQAIRAASEYQAAVRRIRGRYPRMRGDVNYRRAGNTWVPVDPSRPGA